MKANLFIVGEPKCGTTALHDMLNQHPNIFMSKWKEPNYFAKDFQKEFDDFSKTIGGAIRTEKYSIRSDEDYLKLFSDAKDEKIIGESSTRYLFSEVAAKEIHEFNPDAKIIAIFREPVSFLESYYNYMLQNLWEDVEDLKEALSIEKERKEWKRIPRAADTPSHLFYSERMEFSKHLKRFLKYFPESQVKVIIYDDFRDDNYKTYQEVLDFLGVKKFTPQIKKSNVGRSLRSKRLRNIIETRAVQKIKRVMPKNLVGATKKGIYQITTKDSKRESISPQFKKDLMLKYRDEVLNLSKVTGRDLVGLWGYDKL